MTISKIYVDYSRGFGDDKQDICRLLKGFGDDKQDICRLLKGLW